MWDLSVFHAVRFYDENAGLCSIPKEPLQEPGSVGQLKQLLQGRLGLAPEHPGSVDLKCFRLPRLALCP